MTKEPLAEDSTRRMQRCFVLDRRLGVIVAHNGCFERLVVFGILAPMTVSAVAPWRPALRRERSLPSSVTGPVLLRALRRLAAISA